MYFDLIYKLILGHLPWNGMSWFLCVVFFSWKCSVDPDSALGPMLGRQGGRQPRLRKPPQLARRAEKLLKTSLLATGIQLKQTNLLHHQKIPQPKGEQERTNVLQKKIFHCYFNVNKFLFFVGMAATKLRVTPHQQPSRGGSDFLSNPKWSPAVPPLLLGQRGPP